MSYQLQWMKHQRHPTNTINTETSIATPLDAIKQEMLHDKVSVWDVIILQYQTNPRLSSSTGILSVFLWTAEQEDVKTKAEKHQKKDMIVMIQKYFSVHGRGTQGSYTRPLVLNYNCFTVTSKKYNIKIRNQFNSRAI
jgi:hypothetical protein